MERNTVTKTISKRPTGVFYIDGNKAFYFEQALAAPIALDFPTDIISNFELINKKKLVSLIQTFIKNNKLYPKNIVMLLSIRVTYDREFPHGSIEMQKNIQEFLELVPYEDIVEKKIISSGKTRVIATNKEVCEAIKSTFIISGFIVSGLYPLALVLEFIPQLKTNLDLSLFVNKLPDLKSINMQHVVEASSPTSYGTVATTGKEKPNKTRLYALGGIFGILLLVLGFVLYINVIAPPKVQTSNVLPVPSVTLPRPTGVQRTIPVTSEINVSTTSSETNISTKSSTTGSF